MKIMEISVKNVTAEKALNGLVRTIAALRLNVVKIPSRNAIPYEMFKHGIAYEAPRTYRTIRNEFERNKSMAAIEAHRQASYRC